MPGRLDTCPLCGCNPCLDACPMRTGAAYLDRVTSDRALTPVDEVAVSNLLASRYDPSAGDPRVQQAAEDADRLAWEDAIAYARAEELALRAELRETSPIRNTLRPYYTLPLCGLAIAATAYALTYLNTDQLILLTLTATAVSAARWAQRSI